MPPTEAATQDTFFDMPQSPAPFDTGVSTPEPPPVKADTTPAPNEPAPAAAPATPQPSLADQMAIIEQRREQQAKREQAEKELQSKWEEAWKPLPRPENAKDLTYDHEALLAHLDKRDAAWAERIKLLTDLQRQELDLKVQAANTAAWEARSQVAADAGARKLAEKGWAVEPAVLQEVEEVFRGNPQAYWQLKTNPEAYVIAAEHVLRAKGKNPSEVRAGGTVSTPNPSAAYTPSVRNEPGSTSTSASRAAALRKMQETMGISLRDEYRKRY